MSVTIKEFNIHVENLFFRTIIDAPQGLDVSRQEKSKNETLHNHTAAELFVCGQGMLTIKTQKGILLLRAGDAAIVPPGVFHKTEHISSDAQVYTVCFMCFENKSKNYTDLYKSFSIFFEEKEIKLYRNKLEIFEEVKQIMKSSQKEDAFLPAFLTLGLILRLLSKEHQIILKQNPEYTGSIDVKRTRQLENLIALNYTKNWTSKDYAEELFVSKRTLDRLSKKRYHTTLHQAIIQKRVDTAENLLFTTDMPVEKIAAVVGFSSLSSFYKAFEKSYGISPAKYRKSRAT